MNSRSKNGIERVLAWAALGLAALIFLFFARGVVLRLIVPASPQRQPAPRETAAPPIEPPPGVSRTLEAGTMIPPLRIGKIVRPKKTAADSKVPPPTH